MAPSVTLRRPTPLSPTFTTLALIAFFLYYHRNAAHHRQPLPPVLLVATLLFCSSVFLFVSPIPQPQSYHNFADRRGFRCGCCLFGSSSRGGQPAQPLFLPPNVRGRSVVPNFGDVISNAVILLGGLSGLVALRLLSARGETTGLGSGSTWQLDVCMPTFFVGTVAVSAGSTYYHWNPNDSTLVWDRLPMTVAFMAILAFMLDDYLPGDDVGESVLPPLLLVGAASVFYWSVTGDLRPYAIVSLGPMLAMPAIMATYQPRHTGTGHQALGLVLYVAAKVCEERDWEIFEWTGRRVSGHTMKHVLAGLAPLSIAHMILVREENSLMAP